MYCTCHKACGWASKGHLSVILVMELAIPHGRAAKDSVPGHPVACRTKSPLPLLSSAELKLKQQHHGYHAQLHGMVPCSDISGVFPYCAWHDTILGGATLCTTQSPISFLSTHISIIMSCAEMKAMMSSSHTPLPTVWDHPQEHTRRRTYRQVHCICTQQRPTCSQKSRSPTLRPSVINSKQCVLGTRAITVLSCIPNEPYKYMLIVVSETEPCVGNECNLYHHT